MLRTSPKIAFRRLRSFLLLLTCISLALLSWQTQAQTFWEEKGEQSSKRFKPWTSANLSAPQINNIFTDDLVVSYMNHAHPDQLWLKQNWYEDVVATNFFQYRCSWKNTALQDVKVYLSIQNYSDGLEWIFWEDVYVRKNQFEVVATQSVRDRLLQTLKDQLRYSEKELKRADVVLLMSQSVIVPQQDVNAALAEANINAESKFVVLINKKRHEFDSKGNLISE